jgi:hypothetical protein
MAEIFGVSTDYLLKDELEPETGYVPAESTIAPEGESVRRVSMEEASEFISLKKQILPKMSIGSAPSSPNCAFSATRTIP